MSGRIPARRTELTKFSDHDKKVRFLNELAILLGCTRNLSGRFPDGRRPDILRADIQRYILFIGDAKQTETPGCSMTKMRLANYCRWLAANVDGGKRLGILVVCFARLSDRHGWNKTISNLLMCAGISKCDSGFSSFDENLNVVWVVLGKAIALPSNVLK
jgi:hypothetical protein